MKPMAVQCISRQSPHSAIQAPSQAPTEIRPSTKMWRMGKKMVKSRFGVIHNWMVEKHSNVP